MSGIRFPQEGVKTRGREISLIQPTLWCYRSPSCHRPWHPIRLTHIRLSEPSEVGAYDSSSMIRLLRRFFMWSLESGSVRLFISSCWRLSSLSFGGVNDAVLNPVCSSVPFICICTGVLTCLFTNWTQAAVFTPDGPISSETWQESLGWRRGNEQFQQNFSTVFTLLCFNFFFSFHFLLWKYVFFFSALLYFVLFFFLIPPRVFSQCSSFENVDTFFFFTPDSRLSQKVLRRSRIILIGFFFSHREIAELNAPGQFVFSCGRMI